MMTVITKLLTMRILFNKYNNKNNNNKIINNIHSSSLFPFFDIQSFHNGWRF